MEEFSILNTVFYFITRFKFDTLNTH